MLQTELRKPLHANDRCGEYPHSWYVATAEELKPFPKLTGESQADICVIGGGFTGLSTALHLAGSGADVVLVEAHRVGFATSGRYGGQVGSGQCRDQDYPERIYGPEDARKFWNISQDAKALVKSLLSRLGIDAA